MTTTIDDIKRSLLINDFIRYLKWSFKTKYNDKIILRPFHIEVCEALIKVYTGEIKNLIINMPPRSGKTEIVNTFVEWTITKHPHAKYIMTSYSDTLVSNSSQQIRDMLNSQEHKQLFNIETKKDTQSKKLWRTEHGGGVYAVSSFGQITGHGAGTKHQGWGGCICIDDPLKPNDARSILKLDNIKEWYQTTLSNRINSPDTPIIVIMQRLHINDLVGHILSNEFEDADEWEVVTVKMLDEDTNTSMWEEFYPADKLLKMKRSNPSYFYSQMQQSPTIKGGNLLKTSWLTLTRSKVIESIVFEFKFITVDTALKAKEKNDYTVYSAFGVKDGKLYLIDMYRGKPLSKEREVTAKDFYNKHCNGSYFRGMFIEQKASGIDLFQRMKEDGYMVFEVERNTDKVFRAENISPYIEIHGIFINEDIPGISDILSEVEAFPNGEHDDIVDTIMDGVEIAYVKGDMFSYEELL